MKTAESSLDIAKGKLTLAVVSHTHWDREWYLPFQEFRLKLADLVDQLLDLLEADPDYRFFLLDGQTIVIEDYLELRPDFRERLRRQIASGRVQVGPWYILPDEFLVSGESLIRNLLTGHRIAREFGSPLKVGYLPDCFGHIAEIPQLLRGFGIDAAIIWRGVGGEVNTTEFCWRAPDGSEVMALHLPHGYFNAHRLPEDLPHFMSRIDVIRQQLAPRATTPYLALMNGSDHAFPESSVPGLIVEANSKLDDATLVHTNLGELIEAIKRSAREEGVRWQVVEGELRDSQRAPLLPGVLSTRMWIKQRNFECESLLENWAEPFTAWAVIADRIGRIGPVGQIGLSDGQRSLPGGYRQSMGLRQAWRYLLQNHPHDSICGCSVDRVHEEMRARFDWSEQIANSLAGGALSGIVATIHTQGSGDSGRPVGAGTGDVELSPDPRLLTPDPTAVVVFNPIGGPRSDFVMARVPVPPLRSFKLVNEEGVEQPCQILARRNAPLISADAMRDSLLALFNGTGYPDGEEWSEETLRFLEKAIVGLGGPASAQLLIGNMSVKPAIRPGWAVVEVDALDVGERKCSQIRRAMENLAMMVRTRDDIALFQFRMRRCDQLDLGFVAQDVPPFGYRTYQLAPSGRPMIEDTSPWLDRIENEYLAVEVDRESGTLTVWNKETGEVWEGLNQFVDGGDCGDEYNYAAPVWDSLVEMPANPPKIDLVEFGPARSTLRISLTYGLPKELTPTRRSRYYEKKVKTPITCYVSLSAGVKRVDVRTIVENRARDHRLRVHFPTGVEAESSYAEGHFGVVERPASAPTGEPDWAEDPVGTHPQKRFVDVNDGSRGLTIANLGLPEYEMLSADGQSAIALTLLRCVGWLSRDDLKARRGHAGPGLETPGSQCIGTHEFEYSIIPHESTWQSSFASAHRFCHRLRAMTTDCHQGQLASFGSFLEVSPPELVVSAIKLPEEGDGLIVRLYNITRQPIEGTIKLRWPFARAELVDLEEKAKSLLAVDADHMDLTFGPAEMATLRFSFL
ncbi:MAG: hypothetical protein HYX94_13020 [Chloroflexi bacterium]|nr:hypothetical protein [Chloroflexota bacterium]